MAKGNRRVSIPKKIFMIAASFSLPIAVLTYLMVASINANITFASKEIVGNAYQSALEDLLHHIQAHQVVFSTCPANKGDCGDRLAQEKSEVSAAFTRLLALGETHGGALELSEEGLKRHNHEHQQATRVQEEWQTFSSALTVGSRVSDVTSGKYAHLLEDIRTMITHIGSTSNLILDPDLDSYYLMDVTLLGLPQLQYRLGASVISAASMMANPGGLTANDKVRIAVSASMLEESDLARIVDSTQVALNEDANFYGISASLRSGLERPLAKVKETTKAYITMLRQLSSADPSNVTLDGLVQAASTAREASLQYWTGAARELDRLLEARMAHYRNSRTISLILAALAVLIAGVGAFLWMRSIVKPLTSLAVNLDSGEALLGKCVEDIYDAGQGGFNNPKESLDLCKRLSDHALQIRAAAGELNLQVRGFVPKAP